MQDVLYDILATGLDPDQSDAPSEAIERFLFEHARAPKTADEFRAFFAVHGLSVRARAQEPVALSWRCPNRAPRIEHDAGAHAGRARATPVDSMRRRSEPDEPVTGATPARDRR